MATANETLAIAAGEIGYSRWTDPLPGTKYGRWYAELVGSSYYGTNGVPFCAMGASWTLNRAGVRCAGFPGAYTPTMLEAARKAGAVIPDKRQAKPGDIAYFNWDGGVVDHVGFIEVNYGGYVQTIEFNTGNGQVLRRTRNWSTIEAIVRPEYGSGTTIEVRESEDDLKPIYNDGGDVYRCYNPNSGEHFYGFKPEVDSLASRGWKIEGIAFRAPKGGTVPVFRLYNKKSGLHMFTGSFGEASKLQADGWTYESVPFFGNAKGTPVYRLYNKNNSDHLFTTDAAERDALIKKGWQNEGLAFNV